MTITTRVREPNEDNDGYAITADSRGRQVTLFSTRPTAACHRSAADTLAREFGRRVTGRARSLGDGVYAFRVTEKSPPMTLAEAIRWARTAAAGDRLIDYDETGLTDAQDPGSRCGFDDAELADIEAVLRHNDLTLTADDRGLVAESQKEDQ